MTRILSFWGKGGVGKTTISAATALYLAEKNFKVLLLSSDPTPSLSEVLDFKLSSEPLKVYKELYALELSEEKVIQLWKERFGEEVYKVASSIFPIERDVIDYVAGAPGIADEFLLYYIYETWKSRKYDFVVWDTTAAGGSIRLLRIEKEFYSHLGEAAKMYLRLKGFFEKLKRGEKDPLDLINEWRVLAENVLKMLSSTDHSLILIATPEELSLHVTRKIFTELKEYGINSKGLIINMVLNPTLCPKCKPWIQKCNQQQEIIKKLSKEFSRIIIGEIPFTTMELKGIDNILIFSNKIGNIIRKIIY